MAASIPQPATTLAILLGASEWPHAPALSASKAFANSASAFRSYLLDPQGLGLPHRHLLDLFDSDGPPSQLDLEIRRFLERETERLSASGAAAQDLMLYFVGHGGFTPRTHEYFLATRSTRQGAEGVSSLRISDLAGALNTKTRSLRRYLILDACFSSTAYTEFMSAPLTAARHHTLGAFPGRGTALLCSSGSRDPSRVPRGAEYTMFSGALLAVLREGDPEGLEFLSIEEVGSKVEALVRDTYPDDPVRPEIHVPDQRFGNVASVPLFPNPAFGREENDAPKVTPPPSPPPKAQLPPKVQLPPQTSPQRTSQPRDNRLDAGPLTESSRARHDTQKPSFKSIALKTTATLAAVGFAFGLLIKQEGEIWPLFVLLALLFLAGMAWSFSLRERFQRLVRPPIDAWRFYVLAVAFPLTVIGSVAIGFSCLTAVDLPLADLAFYMAMIFPPASGMSAAVFLGTSLILLIPPFRTRHWWATIVSLVVALVPTLYSAVGVYALASSQSMNLLVESSGQVTLAGSTLIGALIGAGLGISSALLTRSAVMARRPTPAR